MPFVSKQGVRIHYRTMGSGPALVLHHMAFGSSADWADFGYVDALKNGRQLVILDSRGHGESSKPHDPAAYALALRASDVLAVLDELGVEKTDYIGYSLGGWIGFELARRAARRFNTLIFGGAHPYSEDMQAFRNLLPRNAESFARMMEQLGASFPPAMRSRWLANDLEALRILTQDRESNTDALSFMTMPCLLYAGDLDPRLPKVKECEAMLPNSAFLALPGCDHIGAFVRSDLAIPHLATFLSKFGL